MNKVQVRARIEEIGIIPAIRVSSVEDALFAAEVITSSGIPIVELTMTVPGALDAIKYLAEKNPDMVVGAGTVLDIETAKSCADSGAKFLTSTGFDAGIVEFAVKNEIAVLPGALTPTEVITAWKAGSDFVKVFPCAQVGGPGYIKALKAPLPQVPLIAAGGVNQQTAADFILAGAVALGIGGDLIPKKAIQTRQPDRIHELARRYLSMVKEAREARAQRTYKL